MKNIKKLWEFGEKDTDYSFHARLFYRMGIISLFTGLFSLIVVFITFLLKLEYIDFDLLIDSSIWGHFGDITGGVVGSIWALTGIFFFISALFMQKEDIKLTRKEMRVSNTEFAKSRENLEAQRRDSYFFSLLELLRSSSNSSEHTIDNRQYNSTIDERQHLVAYMLEPKPEIEIRSGINGLKYIALDYHNSIKAKMKEQLGKKKFNDLRGINFNRQSIVYSELKMWYSEGPNNNHLYEYFTIIDSIVKYCGSLDPKEQETNIALLKGQIPHICLKAYYYYVVLNSNDKLYEICDSVGLFDSLNKMHYINEMRFVPTN